ncbi:hypothetical protein WR25_05184 [Diploscapter pachys]|uniref:Uncharacterized protein n=1 Tax=Diploscapter pachys TaxID=2018661 RepID=A0A2A2K6R9_9BILA|nr:hypothetical protein WR25_05184 [Diploscapter pachys]
MLQKRREDVHAVSIKSRSNCPPSLHSVLSFLTSISTTFIYSSPQSLPNSSLSFHRLNFLLTIFPDFYLSFKFMSSINNNDKEEASSGCGSSLRQEPTVEPQRAVPLSTRSIAFIVVFLAIYSAVYLFYAQHHRSLFYVMTGAIALWICVIYTYGILAIFYMLVIGYKLGEEGQTSAERDRKGE